jgi:hypothetical protein
MGVVIAQSIMIALVLAYIIAWSGADSLLGAVWIGVVLRFGLSAMQSVGSMLWEKAPLKMAPIHGGNWLMKIMLICLILGIWR